MKIWPMPSFPNVVIGNPVVNLPKGKVKSWIPVRQRTDSPWRTFAGMTLLVMCGGAFSNSLHALQVSPSYQLFTLERGETVTRELMLTNNEGKDLLVIPSVNEWVKSKVNKDIPVSSWLTILNSTFSLRKGESRHIKFTAHAPKKAKGEVMGMLSFDTRSGTESSLHFRLSAAVYVGIKGTEQFKADIPEITIINSSDSVKANFTLHNTGNVHIRPYGFIQIKDAQGQSQANIQIQHGNPTHPGQSRAYGGQVKQFTLKPGKYTAVVTLTDLDRRFEISIDPRPFVVKQGGEVEWK